MSTLTKHLTTASIILRTGAPGSGKSHACVADMAQLAGEHRPVFASGFNGLAIPGVIAFDDPRQWKELPSGAFLFVDEAQNWFRARRSGDPPKYLTDMETIRHDGVTLILTTQQPTYLDTHIRGLVGLHEHFVCIAGQKHSTVYRTNRAVIEDVKAKNAFRECDSEKYEHDPAIFPLYKSAEVHTRKFSLPAKWKKAGYVSAFVLALLACVFYVLHGEVTDAIPTSQAAQPAEAPTDRVTRSLFPEQDTQAPQTLAELVDKFTPRHPALPWSAPAYDDLPLAPPPKVACISSAKSCRCLTDQGSQHAMPDDHCRRIALHGPGWNPYMIQERPAAPAMPGASAAPLLADLTRDPPPENQVRAVATIAAATTNQQTKAIGQ